MVWEGVWKAIRGISGGFGGSNHIFKSMHSACWHDSDICWVHFSPDLRQTVWFSPFNTQEWTSCRLRSCKKTCKHNNNSKQAKSSFTLLKVLLCFCKFQCQTACTPLRGPSPVPRDAPIAYRNGWTEPTQRFPGCPCCDSEPGEQGGAWWWNEEMHGDAWFQFLWQSIFYLTKPSS